VSTDELVNKKFEFTQTVELSKSVFFPNIK